MAALVEDFRSGTLTGAITDSATTIFSAEFADIQAISADTMSIVLDPQGVDGDPEIVTITNHGASDTDVTVTRGANNRAHAADTRWVHAVTAADLQRMGFEGTYTGDVVGNVTGDLTGDVTGNADTATNASTATALQTARTIGGVSFDGTANINLPGVNTAGNQDTSGNAATATLAANSSLLGGLGLKSSSGTPSGSQVIRSHTNGYTYLGWINTPSGSTTSTINRIFASNDNFVRYITPATFRSQIINGQSITPTNVTGGSVHESDYFEADVNGTRSAPAYRWDSDTNIGLYRSGTDEVAVGVAGECAAIFVESTNNNTGSAGDGYVAFNTYMGGTTGTAAVISSTTVSGESVKRLLFNSSTDDSKDTPVPWEMSDEAFKKIKTSSYHYHDTYVDDFGTHQFWDKARALSGDQIDDPPDTWVPLKRFGFMWSQLMEHEELWPLVTDLGIHEPAMLAAITSVVQRLIDRVEVLEAAA